jgi:hypothetical protein
MSEQGEKPKQAAPPPAPPKAAPVGSKLPKAAAPKAIVPKTPAGLAALEQHRVSPDWDAIASAAIKASGVESELEKLRVRHQRLVDAGHQACDNVSALFAALAQEIG